MYLSITDMTLCYCVTAKLISLQHQYLTYDAQNRNTGRIQGEAAKSPARMSVQIVQNTLIPPVDVDIAVHFKFKPRNLAPDQFFSLVMQK